MNGEASRGPRIILQGIVRIGILVTRTTLIGNLPVFTSIMGTHIESMILQQILTSILVDRRVVEAHNYFDIDGMTRLQTPPAREGLLFPKVSIKSNPIVKADRRLKKEREQLHCSLSFNLISSEKSLVSLMGLKLASLQNTLGPLSFYAEAGSKRIGIMRET